MLSCLPPSTVRGADVFRDVSRAAQQMPKKSGAPKTQGARNPATGAAPSASPRAPGFYPTPAARRELVESFLEGLVPTSDAERRLMVQCMEDTVASMVGTDDGFYDRTVALSVRDGQGAPRGYVPGRRFRRRPRAAAAEPALGYGHGVVRRAHLHPRGEFQRRRRCQPHRPPP
jgi:hypothetical protein